MPASEIGALVRRKREARGWSQSRLAELLCMVAKHHTITRHDISRWESGKRVPGPFWLEHLATVLRVPLETLKEIRRRTLRGRHGHPDTTTADDAHDPEGHLYQRPDVPKHLLLCSKRYRFAKDQWTVRPATLEEAEALSLPYGAPVLHVIHVARADDGQVLEVSESAWPASRLMLVDEYEIDQSPRACEVPSQV